ncbi:MAG: response regulator transcription factor [Thermoleophilia bacterium]
MPGSSELLKLNNPRVAKSISGGSRIDADQEDLEKSTAFGLNRRELEILKLLTPGLTNKEIAARLHISPETVKTYITRILQKLGARNRTEAVGKALALRVRLCAYPAAGHSACSCTLVAESSLEYEVPPMPATDISYMVRSK